MQLRRENFAEPGDIDAILKMRRIAVHFCPALSVISRTTSFTNNPNSSESGATPGARMIAFRLSASMFRRIERATTFGCVLMRAAVAAEPVKQITSSSRA